MPRKSPPRAETPLDLVLIMGFEHKFEKYSYDAEDGTTVIAQTHMITHPAIPGLLLAGRTLEDCVQHAVWVIKTLSVLNELKVRKVKS